MKPILTTVRANLIDFDDSSSEVKPILKAVRANLADFDDSSSEHRRV